MENFSISWQDVIPENTGQINEKYEIKEQLGEGAYGSVRKATHRLTREDRAVKILSKKNLKTPEELNILENEVAILRSVDHPNILKVYETYQDKFSYFIVTELCSGGELFDRIIQGKAISERDSAHYFRQILSCLVYLHDRHIIHRDLKPENFLFCTQDPLANLKLIDFGTATQSQNGEILTKKVGTSYYIAPEVMDCRYNEKCDVWSAGVILYLLISGFPPFNGRTDAEIMANVKAKKVSFTGKEWKNISNEAKDLLGKMINSDPLTRISAKEALEHPWLQNDIQTPLDPNQTAVILNNLRSFHWETKLQKATMSFIVSQLTTRAEREEMLELFKSLDKDNNGTLSRQEILEGMTVFARVTGIDSEIDMIMSQVDSDGSGEIDYTEFITATLNRTRLLSRDRLEMAFKLYDIDGSGTITKDELKAIFGKQRHYDDAFWEAMINEVDKNGDGVVDIHEFSEMMLSLNNN
ncbi:hypothetical protein SteCoe_8089 [Stentor coeruleus]|uniref:Calcium-dependent protein kinase 1 n=1 Tax=Stentor coeruleus TaxID=5963 RepID=A0A1R2CL27_9CILI|nr:hypothetical protein SteCoe_8089 [Stentor coeruleus]